MADIASSAGSGAAAGAVAGSVVPGAGTVAGAAVGGAIGLAAGIMQSIQLAKAHKADQAQIDKLEGLLNKVKQPNFDVSRITPDEYKVVGTYNPKLSSYLAEKNPTLVTGTSAEAQQGADARSAVLQRYKNISDTGTDSQSAQLQQDASKSAATQAAGTMGVIQNNMAARGLGGGGTEMAMKLAAADSANQSNATQSQGIASSAYQNRLQALAQAGRIGQDTRTEGLGMEQGNANSINNWNVRAQSGGQQVQNANDATSNTAQLHNLGQAQSTANANTTQNNAATVAQQTNNNIHQQTGFQDNMQTYGAHAGLEGKQVAQNDGVAEGNMRVIQGVADTASIAAGAAGKASGGAPAADLETKKKNGYYTGSDGVDYGSQS